MHYTFIKNHVISSHKELWFLNIHLHTLHFLMDDNVGAYSNSIKVLFLDNVQIHDDSPTSFFGVVSYFSMMNKGTKNII
jgi:hypothetical protein